MRGLYAIVDVDTLGRFGHEPLAFARAVLAARPAVLQLRAKSLGARDTLTLLRALLPECRRAGTLLFANDRADLAKLAAVDGVHVGQADLGVPDVRRFAPELRVGVSSHDERELVAALGERPDYVAYGPVYATASKLNPDPVVGIAGLSAAHARAREVGVPLVAIGGIDETRAAEVGEHAELAAVIAALVPDVGEGYAGATRRAERLSRLLGDPA
ncbi:MAG: thiamine phosphate synthase [Polyangiaceae bacterium]